MVVLMVVVDLVDLVRVCFCLNWSLVFVILVLVPSSG